MANKIKDEFSGLKISAQRRWQLRRKRDGKCVTCGKRAVTRDYCLAHATVHRESQRRYNSITYRLEAASK